MYSPINSTNPPVYNPHQLAQLCVEYLTEDLKHKAITQPVAWFTLYLEHLPQGKHGIVVLALLNLLTFNGEYRKAKSPVSSLLLQAPVEVLFVLALLRACDAHLIGHLSADILDFKNRVIDLVCRDVTITKHLVKVALKYPSQKSVLVAQATGSEAPKPSRVVDALHSLVQNVVPTAPQDDGQSPNEDLTAILRLECGSKHVVGCLARNAPPGHTHFESGGFNPNLSMGISSSVGFKPNSPEVEQWAKLLNALRSEFEVAVQSVIAVVDTRKFEKDLFSLYTR